VQFRLHPHQRRSLQRIDPKDLSFTAILIFLFDRNDPAKKTRDGYSGDWKDGKPHGHGIKMYPDQSVYMGNWENGQRSGIGTFRNLDGTKYEGDWAKDLRNGAGRLSFPNGDVVEGSWKKDTLHGTIQYSFLNGDVLTGKYQKGAPIGDVSVTLKDSGKEQIFPWPETDASTVEAQAHAARDHAKSLLSE
jgi:hypothetical protein